MVQPGPTKDWADDIGDVIVAQVTPQMLADEPERVSGFIAAKLRQERGAQLASADVRVTEERRVADERVDTVNGQLQSALEQVKTADMRLRESTRALERVRRSAAGGRG